VGKLRHRQGQAPACTTQLTSSETTEPPKRQPPVTSDAALPSQTPGGRRCPGCIYLARPLPGTRAGARRREPNHSLPGDEPNANPTPRHRQRIPSSVPALQQQCWTGGRLAHGPKPAAPLSRAGPGGEVAPSPAQELHLQEAAAGKSLPPWISTPESDAKGRNSTAVSNAQLTPTTGSCQEKGRGKGETTTTSIRPGPERLLNQRKDVLCPRTRRQVSAG